MYVIYPVKKSILSKKIFTCPVPSHLINDIDEDIWTNFIKELNDVLKKRSISYYVNKFSLFTLCIKTTDVFLIVDSQLESIVNKYNIEYFKNSMNIIHDSSHICLVINEFNSLIL